tara:strand:- start:5408 stop:6271 length:864 start_codon:yes stop_codon:yes gene_type:complete
MSVTKRNANKPLKVTILILGGLLIAAGLTPYINSYLLTPQTTAIDEQDSSTPLVESTENLIVNESSPPMTFEEQETKRALNLKALQVSAKSKNEQIPLPKLNDSDTFVIDKVSNPEDKSLFISLDIIRNLVVFVDNFAQGELVSNFSPLQKPLGKFVVEKKDDVLIMNAESYQRYDKYAQTINNIDAKDFMYLYALLTPLIDEAYQEIGYPSGSFNTTFDKAIEHLLETPVIRYNLELISPSVMYKYADESLEALPDTQKLMLRMGPDNLQTIKFKLREIQSELQQL